MAMVPMTEAQHHLRGVELMLSFAVEHEFAVTIEYTADNGEHTRRVIEPYALQTTQSGEQIVRTRDRRSGTFRTFRLDRIDDLVVMREGFILDLDRAETGPQAIEAGALVDYHGSKRAAHGVMAVAGPCRCAGCVEAGDTGRWQLAWRSTGEIALFCVRRDSFRVIDQAEADEIEAFDRVRAEIADIDGDGYQTPAMRWTPDYPLSL